MKALSAIAPWIAVALLLAMLAMIGDAFTVSEGTAFELPAHHLDDTSEIGAAAVAMPSGRGMLVFFDDTRYVLDDPSQAEKLRAQIRERMDGAAAKTLLVLADGRSSAADLMKLAKTAREGGAAKILFAGREERETAP